MALVNITNMIVLDNPSSFSNDFQFEIEFECLGELEDDLEWKVTYVGSADDATKDQVLEEVMVGPVPQGVSKFVLTAESPDTSLIPIRDLVGITVVLVTCAYREKEFVRIGYYVNNEYYHFSPLVAPPPLPPVMGPDGVPVPQAVQAPEPVGPEELEVLIQTNGTLDVNSVYRNIMSDKPRVTRFQIDWTPAALQQQAAAAAEEQQQQQQQQELAFQQQQQQHQQQQMMFQQEQQQPQQHHQEAMAMTGTGGLPAPPLSGSGMMDIGLGNFAQQQQQLLQQQQQQAAAAGFGIGAGPGPGAMGY